MSDERQIVQLSLAPGSLDDLLAGQLGCHFWLAPSPSPADEETYRLSASVPADDYGEALMRWVAARGVASDPGRPRIEPPSERVAELVEQIDEAMVKLGWTEASG